MKNHIHFVVLLAIIVFGINTTQAQDTLGQQAYAILENKCLNCHGTGGSFTENLLIQDRDQLIATGSVVPINPNASELYLRLISTDTAKRMPLAQPALSDNAIATIRNWITQGAPDWEVQQDINFITTDTLLNTIQAHLTTLASYERPYARYFTLTHLYNAGETTENLQAYRNALSKLVNSLSWGHDIIKPHPINPSQTLLYIDLRHYEWDEWDTRDDVWKRIEQEYPYTLEFNQETEFDQFEKLDQLRQETQSNVPLIHTDWFLATASLPPLYHDILRLPDTDLALEQQIGINVARNILQSPGTRVSRAGIVDSGVSKNNRVVERHTSVYGAYWKSYDFAGSVGAQNIRTHPLSFQHDGGEIVFNLPNGLQAYYISDDKGNRIDKAPTDIVSNPAASDPAVRNGLSCIGCHTQGMKTFDDVMRTTIQLTENPTYDKIQALRLYVGQDKMDTLLEQDTEKYRQALVKATGAGFEDIEPVHRAHEVFEQPLDTAYAAAALGLKTETLVQQIQDKQSLQNLGLTALLGGGTINRDAWTAQFANIVDAINSEDSTVDITPTPTPPTPIGNVAYIPDRNLLAAIADALGKPNASTITITEMETLTQLIADDAGIRDLTGLEKATKLQRIELRRNAITDLTPLTGLIRLNNIKLRGNNITDVSPLANLKSLDWLGLEETNITDLSPLTGLARLKGIGIENTLVTDLSPLAKLPSLEGIRAWDTRILDFAVLAPARRLKWIECSENPELTSLDSLKQLKTLRRLEINNAGVTNINALTELTQLETLQLRNNHISDLSPLRNLKNLKTLYLHFNLISDLTPLAELTQLNRLILEHNIISDVSPLANLTNLTHLDLRENAIVDFSPLEGLFEKPIIRSENNPGAPQGGPKIEGPWLWMIAPTDGKPTHTVVRSGIDFLAQISGGTVTETQIATEGAISGNPVGTKVWTAANISPTGANNINDIVNKIGWESGDVDYHVAYGSIQLYSQKQQETTMLVGSGDGVKVWLNGTLVHTYDTDRWSNNYSDRFAVTLEQGRNVLLVAVYESWGGWSGFFGFETGTQYSVLPPADRFALSTETTDFAVGNTFTVDLKVTDVADLAGWQSDIHFDPAILKVNSVREGIFLKQNAEGTHFRRGTIDNTAGRINGVSSTRITQGGVDGEGTLLSVTFTIKDAGETQVTLHGFVAGTSTGETITATPTGISVGVKKITPVYSPYDVNEDGIVNVADVIMIASALLGYVNPSNTRVDVNGDGVVDKHDLILVAQHLDEEITTQAAPGAAVTANMTAETVQHTLDILKQADDGSPAWQHAIAKLEQLLDTFIPEKNKLLANYPNPFNPETWIPYQLAAAEEVTVSIYAADGTLVRALALGHQTAGRYENRSRAAYWDGKNDLGEPVASGLYFYTLTAGEFTATQKMLIRK